MARLDDSTAKCQFTLKHPSERIYSDDNQNQDYGNRTANYPESELSYFSNKEGLNTSLHHFA